ncbi:MAG: 30S ribosome-binding factor RbfA [Oscillospiraceae bacterium]|nr:30S ribosome-binding factor RbfA [Oscillospiraceae bacterium]
MANYRAGRINESVAHELNDILRDVKDPRITDSLVTINAADVTRDLKQAKVYFGCITGDPETIRKGLDSAKGFMRRELAARLNLRMTPDLSFFHDISAEHGANIARILKKIESDNVTSENKITGNTDSDDLKQ